MRYRKSKLLYRWFNSITHSTFWNRVRWTELWKSIFLSPPNTIPKSRMIEFCNFTLHDGWRRYAQLKQAMTTVYAMARNFSCQWGKNSWQCVGMRVRWNSACHTSWRKFRNFEKHFQGVNEKKTFDIRSRFETDYHTVADGQNIVACTTLIRGMSHAVKTKKTYVMYFELVHYCRVIMTNVCSSIRSSSMVTVIALRIAYF